MLVVNQCCGSMERDPWCGSKFGLNPDPLKKRIDVSLEIIYVIWNLFEKIIIILILKKFIMFFSFSCEFHKGPNQT